MTCCEADLDLLPCPVHAWEAYREATGQTDEDVSGGSLGGISEVWRDFTCDNCGEDEVRGDHLPVRVADAPEDHPAKPWAIWCPYPRRADACGYWRPDPPEDGGA